MSLTKNLPFISKILDAIGDENITIIAVATDKYNVKIVNADHIKPPEIQHLLNQMATQYTNKIDNTPTQITDK